MFGTLSEPLLEALEKEEVAPEKIPELVKVLVEEGSQELLTGLTEAAPEMLLLERKEKRAFKERNYQRWKEPFDLLKMLWVSCQEISENHAHEGSKEGGAFTFEALAQLQPKALLIANEIISLLHAGFADGALARWRTLHEVVVTAMFIARHGEEVARAYLLNRAFTTRRAANQYNEHAERAGLEPFDKGTLDAIEGAANEAEKSLGRRLKSDWDWAAKAFPSGKRLSFIDLERDVELDHWRPRYKWASQHIHSGTVNPGGLLGMSEAEGKVLLVGPSNSGMIDPIHMTAISLMQITVNFMFYPEQDFDRIVFARVLEALVDEIGEVALATQDETLKSARQNNQ
jgi:Family of unknown function (DUF5677)